MRPSGSGRDPPPPRGKCTTASSRLRRSIPKPWRADAGSRGKRNRLASGGRVLNRGPPRRGRPPGPALGHENLPRRRPRRNPESGESTAAAALRGFDIDWERSGTRRGRRPRRAVSGYLYRASATFKPAAGIARRGRTPAPRRLPGLHRWPKPVHGEPHAGPRRVRRAARHVPRDGVPAVGPAPEQARRAPPEGVEDPPAREDLPGPLPRRRERHDREPCVRPRPGGHHICGRTLPTRVPEAPRARGVPPQRPPDPRGCVDAGGVRGDGGPRRPRVPGYLAAGPGGDPRTEPPVPGPRRHRGLDGEVPEHRRRAGTRQGLSRGRVRPPEEGAPRPWDGAARPVATGPRGGCRGVLEALGTRQKPSYPATGSTGRGGPGRRQRAPEGLREGHRPRGARPHHPRRDMLRLPRAERGGEVPDGQDSHEPPPPVPRTRDPVRHRRPAPAEAGGAQGGDRDRDARVLRVPQSPRGPRVRGAAPGDVEDGPRGPLRDGPEDRETRGLGGQAGGDVLEGDEAAARGRAGPPPCAGPPDPGRADPLARPARDGGGPGHREVREAGGPDGLHELPPPRRGAGGVRLR